MSKAPGLGRGLSALLGEQAQPAATDTPARSGGVREIEIGRIKPNPNQPRVQFSDESIDELAESIAQRARLHAIPAIVREVDDSTTAELALIENVQREDLNAIEEADAYRQLIQRYGHGQDEVARLVHKSRSHVANLLRLLNLPEAVRQSLVRGDINMGHARAIATSDDPEALAREIIERGLSVRQAEALAKKVRPGAGTDMGRATARAAARNADADIAALERQLGDVLGLKVRITHNGASGTVSLSYSSLDQLDMVCQRLSGEPI